MDELVHDVEIPGIERRDVTVTERGQIRCRPLYFSGRQRGQADPARSVRAKRRLTGTASAHAAFGAGFESAFSSMCWLRSHSCLALPASRA